MGEVVVLKTEIIVAVITAISAIIVAIIGYFGNKKKFSAKNDRTIEITQQSLGDKNTLIGIQITREKDKDNGQ